MTLPTRVAGLALAPLLLAGLAVAPATAGTGSAPVTAPDSATVAQDAFEIVDVLANDTDPDGDELSVCRFGDLPGGLEIVSGELLGEDAGKVVIAPNGLKPGTYTITYYACDFSYLTPGTLTLKVTKPVVLPLKVKKLPNRPGKLWVVNHAKYPVNFVWGSYEAEHRKDFDGDITLTAGSSRVIDVRRRSVIWIGFNNRHSAFKIGFTRGIELPAGIDELPPGAPTGDWAMATTGRVAALLRP